LSLEVLRPSSDYEVLFSQQQLGLIVGLKSPLRVIGLSKPDQDGNVGEGECGRRLGHVVILRVLGDDDDDDDHGDDDGDDDDDDDDNDNDDAAAEKTGRVHTGDLIIAVEGQSLASLSRKEFVQLVHSRRPVSIEFAVSDRSAPGSYCSPLKSTAEGVQDRLDLFDHFEMHKGRPGGNGEMYVSVPQVTTLFRE
jgi:hypothetical protein